MTVRFGDSITLDLLDAGDTFAFPNGKGFYMFCEGDATGCVNLFTGEFQYLVKESMKQEVIKIDNLVLTMEPNNK